MKSIELDQMEEILAGGWFTDACWAFGSAAAVWQAGAMLNIWNPIGQGALVGMAVVGVVCIAA